MILPDVSLSSVNSRIAQRGLMVVMSSPSGAGKSTISRLLRDEAEMRLALSVSVTTRQRRPSEVDGVHYHFISVKEFERRRDNDELIEWAEVHGNYYGTLRETTDEVLSRGQDMLFDIDYQGAAQLQQKMPQDVVSIFLLPPSIKELRSRLHRRAEDSDAVIDLRLENARVEMRHWQNYDYILVNEDLDRSFTAVKAIITAERLKRERRPGMQAFVDGLIAEK